jgi:hypothetical protein
MIDPEKTAEKILASCQSDSDIAQELGLSPDAIAIIRAAYDIGRDDGMVEESSGWGR